MKQTERQARALSERWNPPSRHAREVKRRFVTSRLSIPLYIPTLPPPSILPWAREKRA